MMRMRDIFPVIFIALILALCAPTPLESAGPKAFVENQVIVKLKHGLHKADGDKIRRELRSKTKHRFRLIDAELWDISGMTVDEAIKKYRGDPRIEYIEPNYILHADEIIPNDPSFPLLWGLHNTGQSGGTPDADIDAPETWSFQTGAQVVIGVIDTGVDRTHPDLAANMWTNPGEIAGNGVDDDGNGYVDDVHGWDFVNNDNDPMDDHGHGTHCSGTIAGIGDNSIGVVGVCWHARIMALKFLDAWGSGSTANAVLAVEYATANGARLTSNSWGGGSYSTALYDAIAAARDAGALFIAAAGNDAVNNDLYPHYPSSYDLDNIISVAATDRYDAMADFSCYGAASVDLGAPGVDVYSCLPGNSYGYKSGTSMATPHVSGAVGLFLSEYPGVPYATVKDRMLASVDTLPVLLGKTVSGGRLNLYGFLFLSEPDSIAPAAVGDLAVSDTASNALTLTWTATGDDGTSGRPSVYDVRYSLSPIDSNTFDSAIQVAGEPRPQTAGSAETLAVRGLDFNSTYYLALKVKDEWGNTSLLSNVPSAVTLGVPHIVVGPDSLADSLWTGEQSKHTLVIENTEPHSTLDFCISIAGTGVSVAPVCGTVSAASSMNVEVTFDASGLFGGNYNSQIRVTSNDTADSVVTVGAFLHVTGASDISVSDTLLDYGPVFIGGSAADTVVVRNEGTDTLRVNGVSVDNGDFTLDTTPFVLGPAGRRDLVVTFGPTTTGLREGTLTILSNDPDEGEVDVALRGEGLMPPVISVAPDSLADSLLTGQTSMQQVTISNTGVSDLIWEAQGAPVELSGSSTYALTAPVAEGIDPETGEAFKSENVRTVGIKALLRDLSGVHILWDVYHGELSSSYWSTLLSDVRARGATVTENSQVITASVLEGYDLLWVLDGPTSFSASEIAAVQAWVRGGGALIFEADETTARINALLSGFGSGITLLSTDGTAGVTTAVYPHATTRDVTSVYMIAPRGRLSVAAPAGRAVNDVTGNIMCAYSEVDEGRLFAISDEIFPDGPIAQADNQLFANQVVDWLAGGAVNWLVVTPVSGTVAAGETDTVDVTFDAEGLFGGNYNADVEILNNDPLSPDVRVPARLHVTGAPDIAVSDTLLDYGPVFIGGSVADTVVVRNEGTDTLRVNGVSVDNGDFTLDTTPFVLGPAGRRDLVVTFGPSTTGLREGTLTILSDDPDEGEVDVALRGEGLMPPVISVAPDSLVDSLLTGQTSTQQVTISNTGASDLAYSISIDPKFTAGAPSPVLGEPIIGAKDPTPNETNPTTEPIKVEAIYSGDYLSFGISAYGEIMPYQYPVGNEHLMVGAYVAGYTVAYRSGGTDYVQYASYAGRSGIMPVSYTELVNDSFRVAVEVVTQTTDLRMRIMQRFMFLRNNKYVRVETTLENISGGQLDDVVFKSYADWDMDASSDGDSWNYDATHNMVYAWEGKYAAIGGSRVPDYMDIHGWNDYSVRATTVDYPIGPVTDYDGLEVLHYEMGDLVAGGSAKLATAYAAGDDLADLQRRIESGLMDWLDVVPGAGTVAAGETDTVDVTFDATGMYGGDYEADIVITNNDPLNPEVKVAARLHVTGASDIAVSDMLLDFGPVFIGGSAADTVVVANEGTDTLRVSGVSVDNGDFTLDTTPFVLGPEGRRDLVVTFGPTQMGQRAATLVILCDDPDEGQVDVALRGEGSMPPVISVAPDSLADSLLTGETSTHQMTISNSGLSDLTWKASALSAEEAGTHIYSLTAPEAGAVDPETGKGFAAEQIRTAAISASLKDLTGVRILWDVYHGELSSGYRSTIVSDLTARGATVTESSQELTAALLEGYDLIWLQDMSAFSLSEIVAVQAWVRGGGALLFESDQSETPINELLSGLGLGITYLPTSAAAGTTTAVYPHATTTDVASVYLGNPLAHLAVEPPAGRAVDDSQGSAVCAYGTVEYGRVYAVSDEIFADGTIAMANNQLLGNQVVDWLAQAVDWIVVTPNSGTVAAGETDTVDVTFDATGMYGGDYAADLVIANNDPLNPEVKVPAHLHVTGAPDIAVSDTLIDFGRIWVGQSDSDTLMISNEGTDTLLVSSVAVSSERFGVDTTGFALAAGEWRLLPVTCNAVGTGIMEGVLTILSDDPDEDTLLVSLRFEAVLPPEMQISPASLTAGLHTGESLERVLTIDNGGGDSLTFAFTERGAAAGGATGLKILIVYADYAPPQMRDSLSVFPDIERVDVFDAWHGTPTLGTLLGYDCVILMNDYQYLDRWALGDALADYVDGGGGVVLTSCTFVGYRAVAGRFGSGGYYPFNLGTSWRAQADLGNYDHGHPIMVGVTTAHTSSPADVTLATGAIWVASWSTGIPFVATKGEHVVGANISLGDVAQHEWTGAIPRLIHNAAFWASGGGGICWADAAPKSGVVSPLGSTQVAVTFNPRSLCAPEGSFDDTLVVSSNAPAAPSVRVPLHLDVIAAPDVAVGDTLLDFGSILIGNTAERTIMVANYGAALLSVSSFTIDNPVFTADVSSFSLAVNEARVITIVFDPVAPGLIEGTLTIASNDPDEPIAGVTLRGQALMPPVMSVFPDSLNASLMRGDSLVRIVQIGNEGMADLEWKIYPLDGATTMGLFTLTPAPRPEGAPSADEEIIMEYAEGVRVETGELVATLADLTGVRVLYDYAHNQYSNTSWWSTFIADLKARGATVAMNSVPITPAVLAACDVYWITDVQAPFATSEIVALRDWVETGGGLLLEGDQSAAAWNAILAELGAGIEYSAIAGTKGVTTQIRPHVMTLDVSSVLLYNNIAHLSSVSYPARLLLNDMAGLANAAHSVAGAGRIVAFADEPFANDYIVAEDNRVLGNQVMDWLVYGANWLNPVPVQGTVPGGDTASVAVTIDPRGLYGGEYDARLHVTSNVPSTPEVTVPVHVSVTGIPALAVSDTTLDFGDVLIGATEPRTLVATNVGTDLLVVSGVRVAGAGFAADTAGVTLPVHGTDTLIVTLTPPAEGPMSGLLTIYSNDPADTARAIELAGNGLVPPQIVVSPGALSDTLYTGGVSSHVLEIENPGEYDLVFTIGENGSGNRILFIAAGADVSFVRSALLAYSDVSAVDVFNGSAGTPSLEYLLSYRCVIVAGGPCADPVAVGNVLADYADRGGGVILTFASHMSGIALQGRIMGAGYSPFTLAAGISTNAVLGSYEAGHPIMAGITWMQSLVYSPTSLVPGAHLVAAWSGGVPAVATMGNHVVGANLFTMNEGSSPGPNTIVVARLLRNAMLWMSGGNICWMDAQPSAGTISPHTSTQIAVTFSVRNEPVCVTEGDYLDTLVVESNVPTMPRVNVPLHLLAIAAPDIVAADSVPDFGPVLLGMSVVDTLVVSNAGRDTLVVSAITSDNSSFSAVPGACSIAPFGSRDLFVHFAPVDTGLVHGTLTIESNDPDEASVPVVLLGTGRSNIALVSPLGGEEWTIGETDTIKWTVSGPAPDSVSVFLSRDGGVSYLDTLATGLAGTTLYSWVVAPPETPSARIMIRSYRGVAVSGFDASDSLFAIVTVTGVDGDDDAPPAVNFLAQNYPNPLNPSTNIDFSLREPGYVSLKIYDAAGRLVRVLVDEPRKAGRYSENWDGRDSRGHSVASGVYYCRLVSGSFTATRKMILLR